jgi:hypothetical protein
MILGDEEVLNTKNIFQIKKMSADLSFRTRVLTLNYLINIKRSN